MKKFLFVLAACLFLSWLAGSANAEEAKKFPPSDAVEYEVVELKMTEPGKASVILRSTNPEVRAAKGDESVECILITGEKNDKKNGFYVKVHANTLLTVGDDIEVIFTNPEFAIPEKPKEITGKEYRFYPGETVFFGNHNKISFAVWFN